MLSLLEAVVIIVIIFIVFGRNKKESFDTNNARIKMASKIVKNRELFNHGYIVVKKKIPWIDAVTYGDVRMMIHNDTPINQINVYRILS